MDADRFAHYVEQLATAPEEDLARYVFAAASSAVLGTARLPLLPPRHFFLIVSIDIGPIL